MPMCRNTSSEKNRSVSTPGRKLRVAGVLKIGSQSNHSALATAENRPSWSHTSQ